jgi:hypothetical protein
MRHTHLFALAAIGLVGIACTTSDVGTDNNVQTQGGGPTGGTTGAAGSGTAGTAGTSSTAGTGGTSSTAGTGGTSSTAGAGGRAGTGTGGTGTGGTGGAGGGSAATALVRFAHFVPDGDAYDVCFRPCPGNDCKAGSWSDAGVQGPVFSGNKDANQFYYPGVSLFFEVDAGTYEIRTVAGAATSCATAVPGIADQTQSFTESHSYTYALIGTVAQGVNVTLSDEPSFPVDGKVGYHVFNALTATGKTDFGINETAGFVPLAMGINPFAKSTPVQDQPTTGAPTFLAAGTNNAVGSGVSQTFNANDEYSVFIYGTKLGDKTPPGVAVCWDNDPKGTPLTGTTTLANCTYKLREHLRPTPRLAPRKPW